MEIIRDSFFGKTVRLLTGGRFFLYPEERDPSVWEKYVNNTKTRRMALHGTTDATKEDSQNGKDDDDSNATPKLESPRKSTETENTSGPQTGHTAQNELDHHHVDPEKGRDVYIVDWYGPDDPEVRINLPHPSDISHRS